ncbi:MAG: hypothetical protein HKM95_12855 [Inquilinus sp.]|nr:hypothetical protein [Inquilinus sp.]
MIESASIAFAPMLPWGVLGPLFGAALLILLVGMVRRARGLGWRLLVMAGLAAALTNPSLVQEEREPIADVAVVVIDESPSQAIGTRGGRADRALDELTAALGTLENLDLRIVRTGIESNRQLGETRLFETLDNALADVPRHRVAGTILLTDGQVHDVPETLDALQAMGPIHTLLTGDRDEADRRLVVTQAPAFGLVGRDIVATVRVDDLPNRGGSGLVTVTASQDGGTPQAFQVPVGQDYDLTFMLEHGGPTVIEMEVVAAPQELTLANNRAAIVVNGVRDRLRVLLVSGEPHPGERTWRNILKSDPSVDLVHFTILRPPEKQDGTPISELSLISFPIRELFELRLGEFDLIIFDRYRRRGVLPNLYLSNIANYVETGGAFLEASGPQFAAGFSLYRTPLGTVLPGEPTGQVFEEGYRPDITDLGLRHPVTADLREAYRDSVGLTGTRPGAEAVGWGRWFRMVDVVPTSGATVMEGSSARPLLILDRVGEGRVAQLMSDHMWLWSRGYEGGGPQSELLRRLAHWLMKEPELEEEDLRASVDDRQIRIERRSLERDVGEVRVTTPSGATETVALGPEAPGRTVADYIAGEPGIFRIEDGEHTALAVVGRLNPPELSDVRTTGEHLAPVTDGTGGGQFWLAEDGVPAVRQVRPERDAAGRNWIGLRANGDYLVTGAREASLLPPAAVLLLAIGGLMAAWRREGR